MRNADVCSCRAQIYRAACNQVQVCMSLCLRKDSCSSNHNSNNNNKRRCNREHRIGRSPVRVVDVDVEVVAIAIAISIVTVW